MLVVRIAKENRAPWGIKVKQRTVISNRHESRESF